MELEIRKLHRSLSVRAHHLPCSAAVRNLEEDSKRITNIYPDCIPGVHISTFFPLVAGRVGNGRKDMKNLQVVLLALFFGSIMLVARATHQLIGNTPRETSGEWS